MPKHRHLVGRRPSARLTPRTEIETLRQHGWPGGYWPDKPHTKIANDELAFLVNGIWDKGYGLEMRRGWELVTTNVAGLDQAQFCLIPSVYTVASLTDQPSYTQEVLSFNDDDGELWYNTLGELLAEDYNATGSDLAYSSHSIGPWDTTSTNYFRTWNIAAATFGQFIYITALRFGGYSGVSTIETHDGMAAGASLPIKYDVFNDTFSRPAVHDLAGGVTGFPTARVAIAQYDRVFVANMYKMSVYRYPNRVYWSDAGTAETFGTNSWLEVGSDDGSEITAIVPTGDSLLIFKDDSTWLLLGTDEDTFSLREISPTLGMRSSTAAAHYRGITYFFDQSNGLMAYDGANFTNVSLQINDRMQSYLNRNADFKTNVQAHKDRIYVSMSRFANDIDDVVDWTFVYDINLKVWTEFDFGIPSDLTEYTTDHSVHDVGFSNDGKAYFSSPNDEVGIFRLEGFGWEDEEAAAPVNVNMEIYTGWLDLGEIGHRQRLRRLDILTSSQFTQPIDVEVYRDFNADDIWINHQFDPDEALDAWHDQNQAYDHATEMWSWLQLRIDVGSGGFDQAQVHGYQMSISRRPFRRGEQGNINQPSSVKPT